MRSGVRPALRGQGVLFLFAGGAVSAMMCPADGQHKYDKKGGTEERQTKKRAKTERKNKP